MHLCSLMISVFVICCLDSIIASLVAREILIFKLVFVSQQAVNPLIIVASKVGDLKRLTYWHSLILAVTQYNMVSPFKTWLTYSTVQKFVFDDTDTNIQMMFVHLLL